MGISVFSMSSCGCSCKCNCNQPSSYGGPIETPQKDRPTNLSSTMIASQKTELPNPNPDNFEITKIEVVGNLIVAMIKYPDCTNYEGNKILLFENLLIEQLIHSKKIDPHFCDNSKAHGNITPVARFVPTEQGFHAAVMFAELLTKIKEEQKPLPL